MSADLLIGLQISLAGLFVTFLSLGLLILLIRLLVRLFPVRDTVQAAEAEDDDADERRREELAAALAVGVSLMEESEGSPERDPSLGKLLEN